MNKAKKFFVKSEKVRQVSDHVVHLPRRLVDIRIVDEGATAEGLLQGGHALEQHGFAGAVGAYKGGDAAFVDVK